MNSNIEIFLEIDAHLGEGPTWQSESNKLYWVDILKKQLHYYQTNLQLHDFFQFEKMPGAVVLTDKYQELLLSFEDGIASFNQRKNKIEYLVNFHKNRPDLRANDGKCDPWGNFWVGTMSKTCEPNAGALYVFKKDRNFTQVLSGITISNGLAWNVTKRKMYYIDSMLDSIRSYDFDPETCSLSNEKTVVHRPDCRYFDGMTIDTDGMLWVAHCKDSCIRRWNPETGEELLKIEMPVPKVTSLCFGGEGLKSLLVTSAQEHMTPAEVAQYPLSGSVFQIQTEFQGFEATCFGLK